MAVDVAHVCVHVAGKWLHTQNLTQLWTDLSSSGSTPPQIKKISQTRGGHRLQCMGASWEGNQCNANLRDDSHSDAQGNHTYSWGQRRLTGRSRGRTGKDGSAAGLPQHSTRPRWPWTQRCCSPTLQTASACHLRFCEGRWLWDLSDLSGTAWPWQRYVATGCLISFMKSQWKITTRI